MPDEHPKTLANLLRKLKKYC